MQQRIQRKMKEIEKVVRIHQNALWGVRRRQHIEDYFRLLSATGKVKNLFWLANSTTDCCIMDDSYIVILVYIYFFVHRLLSRVAVCPCLCLNYFQNWHLKNNDVVSCSLLENLRICLKPEVTGVIFVICYCINYV